ncbi:NADH:ubiquinone oxidoreductase subunit B14.5a family-containing protein [Strongyloides ratti]|uniref:NADH dehydrogenase [ubiquinone] 1 alpha subcomplex subunit 7 n=1 Tax=Strongyloides ratti TaxID=34506 RepID=A0A090MW27_STRRB|nr:NADH:ubiquinone oxidoreductase subunit B14.5a family-containing protein [Strongyloides ratti]CEF63348.1 NADH:ubiquinone oxidoreductase subunit B14.5a family-containing protein [Strongyloides ratti]
MSKLKKIASETVQNRRQTPLMEYVRDKLLAAYRDPITPQPGLPKGPEESPLYYPHRFPNTQSNRSPPPPNLPPGVYHKLSDNYYLNHDARRSVEPPKALYKVDASGNSVFNDENKEASNTYVNKGPEENFGLNIPTPGFGLEWSRNIQYEQLTQQKDPIMKCLERYDKYLSNKR